MHELDKHISQNQLEIYLNKAELVTQTAEQIIKDFAIFGLDISFSGITVNAYTELHQQLIAQIDYLLRISPSKLVSVLYRIDLSEDELLKGEKELPNYNSVEAMAHLIIVRELKKVLSRKFYTTN
ncbi:MAG TPA: hypothetical protein PLU17_10690 [Chitinophagaceae bacterium]|nr:hypothetical protein [Chitinophagaceae bacterium]